MVLKKEEERPKRRRKVSNPTQHTPMEAVLLVPAKGRARMVWREWENGSRDRVA